MNDYIERKEGNVLFNDTLNTFYLRLYGIRNMVKRTIQIVKEKTCCRHMGYSFQLASRVLLYAPSQTGQHIPRLLLHQSWDYIGVNNIMKKITEAHLLGSCLH